MRGSRQSRRTVDADLTVTIGISCARGLRLDSGHSEQEERYALHHGYASHEQVLLWIRPSSGPAEARPPALVLVRLAEHFIPVLPPQKLYQYCTDNDQYISTHVFTFIVFHCGVLPVLYYEWYHRVFEYHHSYIVL